MRFNPEEIVSVLRKEIEEYRSALDVAEVGTILEVGDGIARVYGLDQALAGEMLEFEGGIRGQVFNLEERLDRRDHPRRLQGPEGRPGGPRARARCSRSPSGRG